MTARPHQREDRSARRPQSGRFTFLIAGFAAGCILSGALALYISQAPLPFVDRGLRKADGKAPAVSAPGASESAVQETAAIGPGYYIQVGAFRDQDEAERLKAQVALMGLEAQLSEAVSSEGAPLIRVRLGPYQELDQVNRAKALLSENGLAASVIRVGPAR